MPHVPHVIRVRDVTRHQVYDLGPAELVLRVPYDMWTPAGAVGRHGALVEWTEAGVERVGRCAEATLGECEPGERVLVHLDAGSADEWWLCEVWALDGVEADV